MICHKCAEAADESAVKDYEVHHDCEDEIKCTCQHKPVGTGIKEPLSGQVE